MAGKSWIIVLIILSSAYGIYTGVKSLKQSQKEREEWNEADKKTLIETCIRDSQEMGIKHPVLTKEYCECSTERITSRFTKDEYINTIKKPIENQKEILLPVFQDCLFEYQTKTRHAENI